MIGHIGPPRRGDWWPRTAASLAFAQMTHDLDDHEYPVRDERRFPWVDSGPGCDLLVREIARREWVDAMRASRHLRQPWAALFSEDAWR